MKLVTYEATPNEKRTGARLGENRIVDLNYAYARYCRDETNEQAHYRTANHRVPTNMRQLFDGGDRSLDAARQALEFVGSSGDGLHGPNGEQLVYRLDEVSLRAPIIPKKFYHTAGNFREHHEEAEDADFSHPVRPWIVFFQNIDAIIGPDDPVVYPDDMTQKLDYELELAVVLKKSGQFFDAEDAEDYVGGYIVFNDITARDIQEREMESGVFSLCKGIQTFCPIGPHIVTPDEVGDPHDLDMNLTVNGELRQDSNTSNMSVTIPEIISHYASMGYSAGDILSTGTVSGVAHFSDDPEAWYLQPGDVMDAYVENVGTLRNPIISRDEWEDQQSEWET